ncbi:hypothetical protein AQUCO_00100036v1 [Aquilegia coerulea]|uniref:Uncharacterized protein n=1 Tax=Aquilegia coerulea TaxID=218851 RepID=A0A2G5F8L0_AQUCA|nr:hypothetical protein AQUCO_00100036v1 [Aquilegia coerulea]
MASSSSSGTLHFSPSNIFFVHMESSGFDCFCFTCWCSSFRDNILAKAIPPAFMLRLALSFLLCLLTVNASGVSLAFCVNIEGNSC